MPRNPLAIAVGVIERRPSDGALVAVIDDELTIVEAHARMAGTIRRRGYRCRLRQGDAERAGRMRSLSRPDRRRLPARAAAPWGTDAVALLRHELGVHIPAMLISGDSSTEAISAMRESSLHVLLKPVLPQELHRLVERLLDAAVMRRLRSNAPDAKSAMLPTPAKKAPR